MSWAATSSPHRSPLRACVRCVTRAPATKTASFDWTTVGHHRSRCDTSSLNPSVLIIDDHRLFATALRMTLRQHNLIAHQAPVPEPSQV